MDDGTSPWRYSAILVAKGMNRDCDVFPEDVMIEGEMPENFLGAERPIPSLESIYAGLGIPVDNINYVFQEKD